MKIRIKGNAVRLRLTKTEVATLCKTGRIEEKTQFPNGLFTYALLVAEANDPLAARIIQNTMEIILSKELIKDWETNDKVGFEHSITLDNNEKLSLLVEKDFVCMDETVEDQTDNYPNPKMQ
ncbi:DUF7009 family protein [Muriicola sp. Z0-33]|uniref:DUF7009 family protein n=1 Tax=Muriicola sp. Z0-33 TaxID=2816957 RepID=UPI00223716A8|nr:hypothetical protein [Muriicola sp. Z0-33]MCW5515684.1 hypothetical protein [Muriicola sp. Z0-33]